MVKHIVDGEEVVLSGYLRRQAVLIGDPQIGRNYTWAANELEARNITIAEQAAEIKRLEFNRNQADAHIQDVRSERNAALKRAEKAEGDFKRYREAVEETAGAALAEVCLDAAGGMR